MRLTEKQPEVSPVRRFASATACALLGLGISGSALALSLHVDALAASDEKTAAAPNGPVVVSPDKMAAQILTSLTTSSESRQKIGVGVGSGVKGAVRWRSS